MSKIYLVAVLCMVSAAAALPLDDGLTPKPKLPPGAEDTITPKSNDLKPTVQDSKESKAEVSKEQPQPNKVDELNINGEKSKENKDSKEPQEGENSKELNKPGGLVESGEDKKKGTSSEELVKGHGNSGEHQTEKPIPIRNPSFLMAYLHWLHSCQSQLGDLDRSHFYHPESRLGIMLPVPAHPQ